MQPQKRKTKIMLKKILLTTAIITLSSQFMSQTAKAEVINPSTLTCQDLITLLEADNPANAGTTLLITLGYYLSTTESSEIDLEKVPAQINALVTHCALPANHETTITAAYTTTANAEEP